MMKSWSNRNGFHAAAVENISSAATNPDLPPPVLDDNLSLWLAQLTLLYGVPLEYLVPDARMLPEESIRFFYLDRNWMDRLIDGAMSVGVLSTQDQVFNLTFFQDIYAQIDIEQLKVRSIIRGETPDEPTAAGGTFSGLLMRSKVVSDYPGVEINGYSDNEKTKKLKILRMDRLSDSLLICIFEGQPLKVDFVQPSEGLHFEFPQDDSVILRGFGFQKSTTDTSIPYPAGSIIYEPDDPDTTVKAPIAMVGANSPGVVDVTKLVQNITDVMKGLPNNPLVDPLTGKDTLTSDGLAIQLVYNRGIQSYQVENSAGNPPAYCGPTDS